MPLVQVRFRLSRFSAEEEMELGKFLRTLPSVVAQALHVEEMKEAHLSAHDIEVWVNPTDILDIQAVDVAIVVEANDYEPRRARLQKAAECIIAMFPETLKVSGKTCSAWVRLAPGAYIES